MTKRMLIDATHPEETRAVVLDGRHLVDFDFETSTKRQLKGNIYLAKITRVEPSLQAAFVDYGGNRHGFLAFSEIHPDYFQIPQADRALLEEAEHDLARGGDAEDGNGHGNGHDDGSAESEADEERSALQDEQARKRSRLLRSYKIQEVVKRRQIMLVQVVKEERGNKGAALTTYLSLAGRYCVLMPNTARGGGISRKIADPAERRSLKEIAQSLEIPQGMGLIVRTAGQGRTKAEIRRDYDYLLRLWNEIRETTLQSIAPKMIYEEGDLIKRALRDLYTRDIEEVLVEGEEGYKEARRLMTMLMPSRARLVKKYEEEESVPLFFKHHVEEQLDGMHSPVVQLPSGGSIVLHTTEALTAIDVNSGRSTRERHIDETAVKTNLEAADEVARQLRLRDVAGLIVIDFIDMSEGRHQRAVEKRVRDALKFDRARIQIGKISQFGLLELSRQRLRASLLELSSQVCPACAGTGVIRSTEGCALQALRAIQGEGLGGEAAMMRLELPTEVALYLLNHKRDALSRLEQRYQFRVQLDVEPAFHAGQYRLEVLERRERLEIASTVPAAPAEPEIPLAPLDYEDEREPVAAAPEREPERREHRRHERPERQDRRPEPAVAAEPPAEEREARPEPQQPVQAAAVAGAPGTEEGDDQGRKRRRRRRRRRRGGGGAGDAVGIGGAPRAEDGTGPGLEAAGGDEGYDEDESDQDVVAAVPEDVGAVPLAADPAEVGLPLAEVLHEAVVVGEPEPEEVPIEVTVAPEPVPVVPEPEVIEPAPMEAVAAVEEPAPAAPKRRRRPSKKAAAEAAPVAAAEPVVVEAAPAEEPAPAAAKRRRRTPAAATTAAAPAPAAKAAPTTTARRRRTKAAAAVEATDVSAPVPAEVAEVVPPLAAVAVEPSAGEAAPAAPVEEFSGLPPAVEAPEVEPLPAPSDVGGEPLPLAAAAAPEASAPVAAPPTAPEQPSRPTRQGWWNRRGA